MSKKVKSKSVETKLESNEISERIKDIKGIFYDDDSGVLTVTEEMPEKKFREILNWSRIHDYGNFAGALCNLFKDTHYEYFFEKTHWGSRPDSISRFFIIEGGNIFSGAYPCPEFWLEWKATFEVVNQKEALKERFWNDLFYYEILIKSSISEAMSKYIFEVYEENRCSFIYEASAMLEKEKECLPNPFYVDLWQILAEAKEDLNNNEFFIQRGLKIEYLHEKIFYPIQKPYLGLCEISKNAQEKASAEIYGPIIAKIEKALEETKKEEIEVKNEESPTTGSKVKKEIIEEKGKEVKDFVVYLPTSTGIGTEISEISEHKIRKEYLQKKNDYSIFIYTRNVFIKAGKELKSLEQMDERIYKLLVIFLRQKDRLIPPIPLYRKAWADSHSRIPRIEGENDVSPYLKSSISELRNLLESVPDFKITKPRFQGYTCKGKFRFCVIIPKAEEKKYILSEAEEQEADIST